MKYPIVQAPMAGGNATPALVHAVGQAGGLGFLAGGYKEKATLREEIYSVRALGTQQFGVNLFVPNEPNEMTPTIAAYCNRMRRESDLINAPLGKYAYSEDRWQEKVELVIQEKVPFVSFTFNAPSQAVVRRMKAAGIQTILTVTSIEEAQIAKDLGMDAVCAQGTEAGGHRASFNDENPRQGLPLIPLVKCIRAHIDIPIIAAGGIMNGRHIQKVLRAGAKAVQLGTAFLCCPESGTTPLHIHSLLNGTMKETTFTRAYTGRYARGLRNDFMDRYYVAPKAYPEMHYVTSAFRKRANALGRADLAAMWAGENFRQIRVMPAAKLMRHLVEEAGLQEQTSFYLNDESELL
ncbi:NAD(P)H-dependent flavin oxidoreductase [Kurthia senegalensis]|uniref:NAD(P)H-dependent flavin oxidoreductase n=1 Tax=Kurthia senegalensis TaxID=1033740 RepID=UPI000288A11F|nr:nitronate monooxygenase [Kurthia senegalensis]